MIVSCQIELQLPNHRRTAASDMPSTAQLQFLTQPERMTVEGTVLTSFL